MKKLIFSVAIIAIFIFIGCGEEEQNNTTLKIINNSDYTFLNVNFLWNWANKSNFKFGTLNSKSSQTVELNELGFSGGDPSGTVSFNLLTTSGNTITCNYDIIIKSYGNQLTFDNYTIVNYSGNKNGFIKDIGGPPRTAILTINNMTDYNLLNVEYDAVDYFNINSGRDNKKNVRPGTKFIYFNLQPKSGSVRCRTEPFTCIDGNNSIIITNNTIITITGSGISNTLKNIFDELN